jgi:catechol 2,3-dioxygenase-like lactoylglutathione lyase family enzyme
VASRAVPVLTSTDVATTLAFYEDLGFENRGAPAEEWDYLILVREDVEIHVAGPAVGERAAGFCFVYVDDADSMYAEWEGKAASPGRIERPRNSNFGMRIFSIFDPDGNEVRVGSPPKPERF